MSLDLSYQNVVHKRMGGKRLVVPTGCIEDVETGGALAINGTNYISTDGKVVEQYESKTTEATVLSNYGVSYVGGTATSQINYYLPTGVANVKKDIIAPTVATTGAIVITSSGCQIGNSTSLAYTTLTISTYAGAAVSLIAQGSTQWIVMSKTTGVTIA